MPALEVLSPTPSEFALVSDSEIDFAKDWAFAYEQLALGSFARCRGHFIAICNRKVIAVEATEKLLEDSIRRNSGYDPDRLVVLWVDKDDVR